MAEEVQAVSRVAGYPLVSDSLAKLTKVYQETKDRSSILRLGCNVAETGFQAAVHVALPILKKLDTPAVNNLACQQLDKLEVAFPVITKPTDVVLDEAKACLVKVVQPTVDSFKVKVNTVRELEERVVGGIKTYTYAAVENAKCYGLASVNGLASAAGLGKVLDVAECVLDSYLPAETAPAELGTLEGSEEDEDEQGEERDDEEQQSEEEQQQQKQQVPPLERVRVISQKVKQRAYERAMLRLRGLQRRSTETLQQLNFTVDLIAYAKQNIDAASECVQQKALEARSTVHNLYERLVSATVAKGEQAAAASDREATSELAARPDALEKNVIQTARALASRARGVMHQVRAFATVLPAAALSQIVEMEQLAESMYLNVAQATGFGDVSVVLLQTVKAKAQGVLEFSHRLTEMVVSHTPALLNLEKAVDWMAVDIKLDGLEFEPPEISYQWRISDAQLSCAPNLANGSAHQ